jgi:hypothetical protein
LIHVNDFTAFFALWSPLDPENQTMKPLSRSLATIPCFGCWFWCQAVLFEVLRKSWQRVGGSQGDQPLTSFGERRLRFWLGSDL